MATVKINPELIKEFEEASTVFHEITGAKPTVIKAIEDAMRFFLKKTYPGIKLVKQVRNGEPID